MLKHRNKVLGLGGLAAGAAAVATFLNLTTPAHSQQERRSFPPIQFAAAAGSTAEADVAALQNLQQMSDKFVQVAEKVLPAVVQIRVTTKLDLSTLGGGRGGGGGQFQIPDDLPEDNPLREFFGDELWRRFQESQPGPDGSGGGGGGRGGRGGSSGPAPEDFERQGLGSGVIVDAANGYILTNNHVVGEADEIMVNLADHRDIKAELVGADPASDIALVKIDAKNLKSAAIGKSSDLKVGQIVMAVGSPFNLGGTVTQGIVSAIGRRQGLLGPGGIEDFVQTDAAVNVGNSGGPLVNLNGEVIGINTAIATQTGMFSGVSFAVPIDLAKDVMEDLIKHGKAVRGYLGIEIAPVDMTTAQRFGLDTPHGALVQNVNDGGPAEQAGLEALDLILEVDGHAVENSSGFVLYVSSRDPGDTVKLKIMRDGKEKTIDAKLGERPSMDEIAGLSTGRRGRGPRGASASPDNELPRLGMSVQTLTEEKAKELKMPGTKGVVITDVRRGGAAYRAGLQPNMVITEVVKEAVETAEAFRQMVDRDLSASGTVALRVASEEGKRYVILEPNAEPAPQQRGDQGARRGRRGAGRGQNQGRGRGTPQQEQPATPDASQEQ